MGYWDATDSVLKENNGHGPPCPVCKKHMYPADDHGTFFCECGYEYDSIPRLRLPPITQVTQDMPDAEKEKIPPINRLYLPPTEREKELIRKMLGGQPLD